MRTGNGGVEALRLIGHGGSPWHSVSAADLARRSVSSQGRGHLCCRCRPSVRSPRVKLSNFLFPESRHPADDARVIDETLREARLTDELGFDVLWLAEHHFDGICAYVDPVSFAAALATGDEAREAGLRGGAGVAAPPGADGRAVGADRQPEPGTADRRAGPRHRLQHLRLPGLRHRPGRGAGALRGSRRNHVRRLARRAAGASRPVLGPEAAGGCARRRSPGRIRR